MGRPTKMSFDEMSSAVSLWKSGYSMTEIAEMFGVRTGTISLAVRKVNGTIKRTDEERILANDRKVVKFKETLFSRYGTTSTMSCPEILQKSKATSLERYGVDSIFKLPETIESRKQTCKTRYGVDHHMKLDSYKKLANANRKQNKNYKFNDGTVVRTQGHGDLALRILEANGYSSSDIITEHFSNVKYYNDGKYSNHIFDIYIEKENRVIEVKGTHPTFGYYADKDLCHVKMDAAKNLGYSYEIWVFDNENVTVIT